MPPKIRTGHFIYRIGSLNAGRQGITFSKKLAGTPANTQICEDFFRNSNGAPQQRPGPPPTPALHLCPEFCRSADKSTSEGRRLDGIAAEFSAGSRQFPLRLRLCCRSRARIRRPRHENHGPRNRAVGCTLRRALVSETKPGKRKCDATEKGHRKEFRSAQLAIENPR